MGQLGLQRDLSRNTLVQVLFVLHNYPRHTLTLPGLVVSPMAVESDTAKFDLSLYVAEEDKRLRAAVEYSTDLFDATTVERMLGHFQTLLEGIVENPARRLSDLPLLTETERHRLLVEWNDTRVDYPAEKCVHELFEAQAAKTPDAIAVISGDHLLTYRELDHKADQLARYLSVAGVKPGALVQICVERSVEMIVGLLGILKAGGAYVPLDPMYPKERLGLMLEDARASLLLTQRQLISRLPEHTARVICLDSDWETIVRESRHHRSAKARHGGLAYMIYTSGSTGHPKGVQITHQAAANFIMAAVETYSIQSGDRILQFASISFDTAVEEIFPCLSTGATLVLRNDTMLESIAAFLEQCREWGITALDLPTAFWHELTDKLVSERLKLPEALRLVIIGGERAIPQRVAQWREVVGHRIRLLNTYGPTESTVVASFAELTGNHRADPCREVTVGRPMPNVRAYLLDRFLGPTPIGVPGELHLGGAGLARGYFGRPELTAEKFIPHPFSDAGGARLYKTGDRARYLPDGTIEFLDRVDQQVKLRGYRIELGEIEAALTLHPGIHQAVALLREDHPGDKRIAAYLVPDRDSAPSAHDLRRLLQQKLPDYMIPSAFVFLESLPQTPSGNGRFRGRYRYVPCLRIRQ
jgi:amino acid adenylation domain-containing protein